MQKNFAIMNYRNEMLLNCTCNVKCALVQALRLCTGRTAHTGSRGIVLPFHYHGTRRGWGVSVTPRPFFTPGKDQVPIVQEAGWAPGPVWTGAENLVPTGIRYADRPARSQSLYRLRYPAHFTLNGCSLFRKKQNGMDSRKVVILRFSKGLWQWLFHYILL